MNASSAASSVLAEIEFLRFAAERIGKKPLVTSWAKIVLQSFVCGGRFAVTAFVGKKLTNLFEMVGVQIFLGQLDGIMGGIYFHFHNIPVIRGGQQIFPAKVAREMQHYRTAFV